MTSLACRSSLFRNVLVLTYPGGSDRMQSVRATVGRRGNGLMARRALRQHSGMTLQVDALNVIVRNRTREFSVC